MCSAQYSVLHSFNDTAGGSPFGALTFSASGNVLYGMTRAGGANGDGCMFSMNTDGTNYKDIFDFNGTTGSNPQGSLFLSGKLFYGMAPNGGANNKGCIFSIDSNGNNYTDLLDFNGTNGANPQDNVFISGTTMYGMTLNGGAYGDGLIFSVQTNGTGFTDLMDFNGTKGAHPYGSLVKGGNVLYGMASLGGAHDSGCVFSVHTNGSGYKDMHDFNQDTGLNNRPANALGTLLLTGKMLFGLTQTSNTNALHPYGNIFKIDTTGNSFTVRGFGISPRGSVIQLDSILFGMTGLSGALNNLHPGGDLISWDTTLAGYNKSLYQWSWNNMTKINGYTGCKALTASPSKCILYGMTSFGGADDDGVIFKYVLLSITTTFKNITCGGGNTGSATVTANGAYSPFTYLWKPGGATTATVTGLSSGTYTVTVNNTIGSTATASVTITQPPAITVTLIDANLTCYRSNNGKASSVVIGGTLPYTYLWSNGRTTANITALSAGAYTFKVTDNSGCTESASVTLTQPTIVSATVTKIIPLCYGSSNGSMTATATGGTPPYTSYAWAPYGGTTTTATGLSAQTYTLVITDSKGCTGTDVVGLGQPTAITVAVPTFTCAVMGGKGTVVANAAGGTPAYNYTWSNGTSTVGTLKTETFPNGSYTVTVTDRFSCPPATASITISGCPTIKMEGEEKPTASEDNSLADITVYPNPSKGLFTVSLGHPALDAGSQTIIEVYDVLGQKVTAATLKHFQHDCELNLSNQPAGIYFYRVIANSGNVLGEGKLVIEK